MLRFIFLLCTQLTKLYNMETICLVLSHNQVHINQLTNEEKKSLLIINALEIN